jgi:hypothetical protein
MIVIMPVNTIFGSLMGLRNTAQVSSSNGPIIKVSKGVPKKID